MMKMIKLLSMRDTFILRTGVLSYLTWRTVIRCSLRLDMTSELDTAMASGRGMDWNNPPVPPPDSLAAFKSAFNFST